MLPAAGRSLLAVFAAGILALPVNTAAPPPRPGDLASQPANTWVKRSPTAYSPFSPRLGYESTIGYDPRAKLLIRWSGHNQGGGGEQNAETWTLDPVTLRWTLKEPNDSPPGVCCGQQNVFDPVRAQFVRFGSFSGNHGWQWSRELALKNSSVWMYDLSANAWRDMRPMPEPRTTGLRGATFDSEHEVLVVFGGEGNSEGTVVYDPHTNTWTRMGPPMQPAFRSGGSMAYDAARKVHIFFGAQFIDDPRTWMYDLRTNRWTDLKLAKQPPTDRNDAVLTYDPINEVVLAVLRVREGKEENAKAHLETWAFDAGKREWTKQTPEREPPPSGNRARLLTFLPDHGVAVLENRTHRPTGPDEQQIWTYRFAKAANNPAPAAPTDLRATTAKDRVKLTWKPSASRGVAKVFVLRGEGEVPWKVELRQLAEAKGSEYEDRDVKPGLVYHYTIVAEDEQGRQSVRSHRARAQPGIVRDLVATVTSTKEVQLSWKSPSEDVVRYTVERAVVEVYSEDELRPDKSRTPPLKEPSVASLRRVGAFESLTRDPITNTFHTDSVDLSSPRKFDGKSIWERRVGKEDIDPKGTPYRFAVFAYRVRAVNALGVAGGPSPYVLTIPSSPQHVFSREKGTACDLRWVHNPERGLKGYRVYRLDGRFNKQPVSRLTPEPITGRTYTDATAGKAARRYHVVAVDAIGQEGHPSTPVWFEREWKRFYEPFVEEWHQ